jgi:transcriptional regulator with XRE-family HTH domain
MGHDVGVSDDQTARAARAAAWAKALLTALRAERGAKKMSVAKLAAESGIPLSTLKNYLSGGRDIPVPALVMIAEALEVDVVQIWVRARERMGDDTGVNGARPAS